jgi:hypothetical protein
LAKKVVDAEVVEGEEELDPTDLRALFFRDIPLSDDKDSDASREKVEQDLKALLKDAHDTRVDLDNNLMHWNDLAEGIAPPKNFPWPNSSNLHIPVAETKLNEVHSAARQTVIRGDQLFAVSSVGDPLKPQLTAKVEQYINYKATMEAPLKARFSDIVWAALRDGMAIAHVYYREEPEDIPQIKSYRGVQEFLKAFPDQEESGLTKGQYQKVLDKFAKGVKVVRLLEREERVKRGPAVDVVELQDFYMSPMTSIRTEHARLVGKLFTLRKPEIRAQGEREGWDEDAIERVVTSHDSGKQDQATQLKDQIEGIARSFTEREKNGDFVLFHGIYRADLNGDGFEEKYLVTFHYLSGALLGGVSFPYVHGRDNFIPVRVKRRPNRFLARGLCQMLDDINVEVNTQHNQRIDSRTISTVPSFKAKKTARDDGFDPSRPDSRFFPGKVWWLTDLASVEQFEIRQTDTSESMQEESALMSLADRQVGATAARSGQVSKDDPRAAASKTRMMLSATDARLDDYFEQIAGDGEDNEGLDAVGQQFFSLLYQFFDGESETLPFMRGLSGASELSATPGAAPTPQPQPTPNQGPLGTMGAAAAPGGPSSAGLPPAAALPGGPLSPEGQPQTLAVPGGAPMVMPPGGAQPPAPPPTAVTITLADLEAAQGKIRIGLAKTSSAHNPENALMRFMQGYSLLVQDPLVGGNPKGRLALDRKLLDLLRLENPEQYLPPDAQTAQQWIQMQSAIVAAQQASKGGRPGARNRGGARTPSAGGAGGGPGPAGGGPK